MGKSVAHVSEAVLAKFYEDQIANGCAESLGERSIRCWDFSHKQHSPVRTRDEHPEGRATIFSHDTPMSLLLSRRGFRSDAGSSSKPLAFRVNGQGSAGRRRV